MRMKKVFLPPSRQAAKKGAGISGRVFSGSKNPLVFSASWRFGGGLSLFLFLAFLLTGAVNAQTETKPAFPTVILCGKKHNALTCVRHDKAYWDYDFDGPLRDLESLPGYYLVTGGSQQVSLLKKEWKGCSPLWDWSDFSGISVESAVVADWDERDKPSLILAADSTAPRLFLADAKSKDPKVRWEYKLTAAPIRVHLCADTGNFLVVLKDSTVEEVFFQQDKVVWQLGKADGLANVRDAVRDPWANTYVADAATGDILCFGP